MEYSSKFGLKYLQSLGWSTGSGLGATGEGRVSNLKIHQKLDLMGIGANRRGGPDDAGWKGGHEFEGLLARLNQMNAQEGSQATSDDEAEENEAAMEEAPKADDAEERIADEDEPRKEKKDKKKRKRSEVEDSEEVDAKEAKRRRKEEKKARKEKERQEKAERKAAKKLKKSAKASASSSNSVVVVESTTTIDEVTDVKVKVPGGPIYRAHRARHLASKRLAAVSNSRSMNEILGIATPATPDESFSVTLASATPSGTQTPIIHLVDDGVQTEDKPSADSEESYRPTMGFGSTGFNFGGGLGFRKAKEEPSEEQKNEGDNLLKKSTMSMADYFAEKMKQKQAGSKEAPAPALKAEEENVEVDGEKESKKRKKSKDKSEK